MLKANMYMRIFFNKFSKYFLQYSLKRCNNVSYYSTLEIPPPLCLSSSIVVPNKLLMGPGPSNSSPRVIKAASLPMLGHLHKEMFPILDEIKAGLQYLFQTKNKWTLAVSGSGHSGKEAILMNLLEPQDPVVIGVNGLWGLRAFEIAKRIGAKVNKLEKPLGKSFSLEDISKALEEHHPKVLYLIHSESSSGVIQNLTGIGELCQRFNCLFAVDTVASMGAIPILVDQLKIDALYTGSQKALACPPGLAPITFSPRAVDVIKKRKIPVVSFSLDMNLIANYWDCNEGELRTYHNTPPVTILFALRESLAEIAAEKLENIWKRHEDGTKQLHAGLRSLGLQFFVDNESERLPSVTTIKIPEGVDWRVVNQYASEKHLVEISGGLGPSIGKVIRIGVMGFNAYPDKIDKTLKVLKESLEYARVQGVK